MEDGRFDEFYREGYPRLVAALTFVTGDVDRARESVDEAVTRAWEHIRRGRSIDELGAWVRVVALNVARGRFRRSKVEERARARLFERAQTGGADRAGAAVDAQRALALLPRRQREITVLHYFLDRSVAEIADELGIAQGTVKSTLHAARSTLAGILAGRDERGTEVP